MDPQEENCLSVLFPVCLAGEWLVDVAVHSSPIRGSPCTLLVTPAPPHAASTTAQGSGLLRATPGSESAFVITVRHNPLPAPLSRLQLIDSCGLHEAQACDAYGNRCVEGGADLLAVVSTSPQAGAASASGTTFCEIVDCEDGVSTTCHAFCFFLSVIPCVHACTSIEYIIRMT